MHVILATLSGKVLRLHNAPMDRLARLLLRREVPLAIAAALAGLAIGYVDSRPTWDDVGVTVSLLLLASAMAAGLSGRHPWLWALLVGFGVPAFEIPGRGGPASLVALLVAAVGSAIGYAVARVAESG